MYRVLLYRIVEKLKALKQDLKLLNKTRFANVEREAEIAAQTLKEIQSQVHENPLDDDLHIQEKAARVMKD